MNKQQVLIPNTNSGAEFSECRKYRYALWRIWDVTKPLVMFIGLNPSTANETESDPTIRSCMRISKHNGYGGFYMMNCWAYISTDPEKLRDHRFNELICDWNDNMLTVIKAKCKDVVFAWGSFAIVKETDREEELINMFPDALCLARNKNGSPKHPLYCKTETELIPYDLADQKIKKMFEDSEKRLKKSGEIKIMAKTKHKSEKILICTSHQDELRTPLIYTYAFSGSEYWCPYCGKNEGMMGAGESVKSTAILRNRYRRFKKLSKDFLDAQSSMVCSSMMYQGKRITPDQLPQEEKDRLLKIIKDWKYKQIPPAPDKN